MLARVVGLFSGRGYNIDSLTVSETEHQKHLSRITIVTRGTPMVLEQIKNQLDRLVPVHRVIDLTTSGPSIARELAMVKVRGAGDQRMEALRLADAFRARVIDATTESFVFEITGATEKIESFISLMLPVGLVEVSRTGVVAIARGPEGMYRQPIPLIPAKAGIQKGLPYREETGSPLSRGRGFETTPPSAAPPAHGGRRKR